MGHLAPAVWRVGLRDDAGGVARCDRSHGRRSMKHLIAVMTFVAGCGSGVHGTPGGGIDWSEPSESLTASSLALIVDGVTFHGTTDQLDIKAPASGDSLDVTWAEAG